MQTPTKRELAHLLEDSGVEQEAHSIALIHDLVKEYEEALAEQTRLELELEKASKLVSFLGTQRIPELFSAYGVSELKLGKTKVAVKADASVTLTDAEQFRAFLVERGDDDIVKTSFELGKVPDEVVEKVKREMFDNYGLLPTVKSSVHPQTLKKYIKDLCGINQPEGEYLSLQDLPDCVKVYTYYKTTVKKTS